MLRWDFAAGEKDAVKGKAKLNLKQREAQLELQPRISDE